MIVTSDKVVGFFGFIKKLLGWVARHHEKSNVKEQAKVDKARVKAYAHNAEASKAKNLSRKLGEL